MRHALRTHWPEYLMEAAGLALFMISAGLFGTLLEYPQSPVCLAIADPFLRRVLMGLAMGLTAVGIIYSPWGQRSGAHINPAVTVTFLRLGKVAPGDAFFYVVAQLGGGLFGVLLAVGLLGEAFAREPVSAVVTVPGEQGGAVAFLAELSISFVTMFVVLTVSNSRYGRYTGLCVGGLIVLYIAFEAPLSGFSMNPARTLASALPGGVWTGWWIYLTAPPLGMLLAAQAYLALKGRHAVHCAKLHHQNRERCIFCAYQGDLAAAKERRERVGQSMSRPPAATSAR